MEERFLFFPWIGLNEKSSGTSVDKIHQYLQFLKTFPEYCIFVFLELLDISHVLVCDTEHVAESPEDNTDGHSDRHIDACMMEGTGVRRRDYYGL